MYTSCDEKASGYVKLDPAICKHVAMGQWIYRILALLLFQICFCTAASEEWRVEVWSSSSDPLTPVYRVGGGCRLGDGQVVIQSPSDDAKRDMESAGLDKGVIFTEQLPTGLPMVRADLLHSERLGEQYPRFAERDFVKDILLGALTIDAVDRPLSDQNRRDYSCYGARCEGTEASGSCPSTSWRPINAVSFVLLVPRIQKLRMSRLESFIPLLRNWRRWPTMGF
mmetsp:Transcript_28289/g.111055  ORF Transcript_28289/g.111055 Transcript_28289/m.111055 type:complete len:225 (-) Transcript_28289:1675-2349(-)